jgi:general secretion pathway protein H
MTPTLALGNSGDDRHALRLRRVVQQGFTLLELMVVVAIVALGAALVTSALPDSTQSRLEEEGTRLSALLEAARTQSRATGQAVYWQPGPESAFRFVGLPKEDALPSNWLGNGMSAEVVGAAAVVLGPEPILPAQRIVLRLNDKLVVLASDGLAAFALIESRELAPR